MIAGLGKCGFIVNQIMSDRASENRSALKQLGTITAEEEFSYLVAKNVLPKKLPVAFPHPLLPNSKIYLGGEMPHWIKKFVNVMENSSV